MNGQLHASTSSAGVAVQSTVTMSGVPLVPPPPGKSVTALPLADVVVRVLSVMVPNELVAVHCTCNPKPDVKYVSAMLSYHCLLRAIPAIDRAGYRHHMCVTAAREAVLNDSRCQPS